jgi:hypothetical protein
MGDDAPTEAVRSAVFGTTELFEQILLQVDMKTLLLSQRVDSQWRDFITDSPALQKKSCFSSPPHSEKWRISHNQTNTTADYSSH